MTASHSCTQTASDSSLRQPLPPAVPPCLPVAPLIMVLGQYTNTVQGQLRVLRADATRKFYWGTICAAGGFDHVAASVACKQVSQGRAPAEAEPGAGASRGRARDGSQGWAVPGAGAGRGSARGGHRRRQSEGRAPGKGNSVGRMWEQKQPEQMALCLGPPQPLPYCAPCC